MKVIITGGCGFIGSNLANQLSDDGHDVMVVDNLFLGKAENLKGNKDHPITFIDADIREVDLLYKHYTKFQPTHFVHLAAISSAPMFGDGKCNNPIEWVNVNVKAFQKQLDAAQKLGAQFLYASTSSLYGNVREEPPYREDMLVRPRTFYESTLYMREILASAYYHSMGYPSIGFRFFSVYGPNETHKGKYANNITQFLWAANKKEPTEIYGNGKQTRDFTHVNDVARAIRLGMKRKKLHGVFNVGTGKETSFNEVIEWLDYYGRANTVKRIPNPLKNYVARTLADTNKSERELKFKAKIPVEKGIEMQVREYP